MKDVLTRHAWYTAVFPAILVAYGIGFLSVYCFQEYGWTLFVVVPFFLGMIPAIIYGYLKQIDVNKALKIGLATLGVACFSTLVFAVEGVICIVMAFPILAAFNVIGSLLGYAFIKQRHGSAKPLYSILLLPALFLFVDLATTSKEYLEVKTEITIHAPIGEVWTNVVSFSKIPPPDEWIFRTGISYPTHAEIKGNGVGAIRYCHFTTGEFVEPITIWDAPQTLEFKVLDQPTPMLEMNPFWDVHPPHLNGYFQSKKGQFKLADLGKGTTLVQATTWYNIHLHPVQYWNLWSRFILHSIHTRVLKHIKSESEK